MIRFPVLLAHNNGRYRCQLDFLFQQKLEKLKQIAEESEKPNAQPQHLPKLDLLWNLAWLMEKSSQGVNIFSFSGILISFNLGFCDFVFRYLFLAPFIFSKIISYFFIAEIKGGYNEFIEVANRDCSPRFWASRASFGLKSTCLFKV